MSNRSYLVQSVFSNDYCYGLNTKTREWRPITIGTDPGASQTSESIFGHSGIYLGYRSTATVKLLNCFMIQQLRLASICL